MKKLSAITIMLICSTLLGISPKAFAECSLWHTECVYDCIQYYPNGTDCWKSKKRCFKVCDDFDVHLSGPTAKSTTSTGFHYTNSRQVLDEGNISVSGLLARIVSFRIDSPRWLISLEKPMVYGNGKIDDIEIQAKDMPIGGLIGKRVKVSGAIEWQNGRIGGKQPILVAKDVVELPTETKNESEPDQATDKANKDISKSKAKTSCSCKSGDGKKSCSVSCKEGESAYCDCDDTTASCTCN